MPEAKTYREKIYAKYATVQVPGWLHPSQENDRINQGAITRRLQGWLPQDTGASCLDLGCGAGNLLLVLKTLGFDNLIGIDLGPEQIAIARARGVTAIQANVLEYLKTSDQSFDLILAFDIIEHFAKDEVLEVLGLIWKCLKPGGRLIIQTPNALSPWASHIRYNDLTHEWIFGPSCLASTLRLCGFKDVELREVGPYIHGIVSAVRWVLWKFVRAGYIAVNCIESGGSQGGVYTRNMLVSALKGEPAE